MDGTEAEISTHTLARRVTKRRLRERICDLISTHTLARRVTFELRKFADPCSTISTHTLARRVTDEFEYQFGLDPFQPTPSHGG